jgi:hypothetical protein
VRAEILAGLNRQRRDIEIEKPYRLGTIPRFQRPNTGSASFPGALLQAFAFRALGA